MGVGSGGQEGALAPTWKMTVKILKREKEKKKEKRKEKEVTHWQSVLLYTFLLSNDQWV